MRSFEYVAPRVLSEALAAVAERGERARVLAGGTDILVQLRAGRRQVDRLVDVKAIPEVNELSYDPHRGLRLGAAVPCYRVYEQGSVAQAYPGLIDAVSLVGGTQIQGRASVGGNLCNAAPSGDTIPALIALGAVCIVASPATTREMPAEDFCTAPGRTVLQPGEMLVNLRIPPPARRSGAAYLRFIPRNEMDIAVVGVGASVVLDDARQRFVSARIALGAVAPTPLLVKAAGEALAGQDVSERSIEAAAAAAMAAARPITDMRGTVEQRRHLVGALTRRALRRAIQRASEE
ncbi:MAG: xanthine dehydrogenase family protein subunit M [Chloroflexi bacterium]|nr:xanthine dehydrogenase family protein subunit M [Chloroflexota bacterium]